MADGFLSRWSRLKREHERAQDDEAKDTALPSSTSPPAVAPAGEPETAGGSDSGALASAESPSAAATAGVPGVAPLPSRLPPAGWPSSDSSSRNLEGPGPATDPNLDLPPLESLTPASDFTPFLRAGVAAATRSAALKTLFQDPHFNVMDGLDIYIDDYTQSEPIPEPLLRRLVHSKTLGLFDEPEKEASVAPAQGEDPHAVEVSVEDLEDVQTAQEPGPPAEGSGSPESPGDAAPGRIDSGTKTA